MISRFNRFNNIAQANINNHPRQNSKKQDNPSFKGPVDLAVQAGTQTLNFLNTSPAIGACFVDFFSMVMPRTLVDFSRSKDAGMETGFREGAGTLNHAVAGIVGLGAGYAVSAAFNKANGIKSHLIFADGNTLDALTHLTKQSETTSGYSAEKYWDSYFRSIEGLNTTSEITNGETVWKKLSEETITKAKQTMLDAGEEVYKTPGKTMAKVKEIIIGETGAGSTYRMSTPKGNIEGSLESITSSAFSFRKAVADKLSKLSKEMKVDVTKIENIEKFVQGIKNKKAATVVAGLSVPLAIGMSAQPINRYLTKKRTGSDGFVGVEGREPDHSNGFKFAKIALGLAMGSVMISTILKKPTELYTNIKKAGPEILSKLQYKGMVPTIEQFKFIYGMTIMSRIFAARDKNEMRESGIKDSLGFANWLILGGFVSKLAAKAFKKGTVNYNEAVHGKGLWNYITKSVEKTHEEILYPVLKKMGISSFDKQGKTLPFRKLMKIMMEKAKGTEFEVLAKETSSRLKYKNYAQLLGYIYSGVVLGVGIPKLNIAITNYFEGKKKVNNTNIDKMKVVNDYLRQSQKDGRDNKTFGAFLNQI